MKVKDGVVLIETLEDIQAIGDYVDEVGAIGPRINVVKNHELLVEKGKEIWDQEGPKKNHKEPCYSQWSAFFSMISRPREFVALQGLFLGEKISVNLCDLTEEEIKKLVKKALDFIVSLPKEHLEKFEEEHFEKVGCLWDLDMEKEEERGDSYDSITNPEPYDLDFLVGSIVDGSPSWNPDEGDFSGPPFSYKDFYQP